jgi:hypothetical protein
VVDVLDVNGALLHARAAGGAGPEHVVVDHRARVDRPDECAVGFGLHVLRQLLALGLSRL